MIYRILDFNFLGTLGLDGFWKTTILIICRLVRVLQLYSPEPLEGTENLRGGGGDPKVYIFEIFNFGKFQVSKWASGMKRLFKVSFKN